MADQMGAVVAVESRTFSRPSGSVGLPDFLYSTMNSAMATHLIR